MASAFDVVRKLKQARTTAVAGVLTPAQENTVVVPLPASAAPPKVSSALKAMLTARAVPREDKPPLEADRILALPTWDPSTFQIDLTDEFKTPNGQQKLRPLQSAALHWLRQVGGLLGPLEVGGGKSLISLLAAVALKAKRPLLLIPPTMQTPLRLMMEKLSDHWKLPENLYIVPYSQLSVASSTRLLEETIRPDLIICDECQNLRNPDAARSKRFLRYLQSSPDTKIVALSGTMTKRGLRDYAHLAEVALKKKSPLPQTAFELMSWAACLDADGDPRETDWDMFAKFHDVRHIQGEDHFETTRDRRDAGRAFFQSRLTRTQGVVGSTEESIGANLLFKRRPVDLPDEVLEALENLRATWMRPDEEELVTALDYWRCSTQLAQGFYYYWDWPHGIVDHLWMNARSRWHKVVRRILQDNVADMDSPLLVYRAVERGQIRDPDAQDALEVWKTVKHRKKPPTATKWISDYLIRDAIEWHLDHPSGLIWQSDRAVERAFREAGMVVYGPGEIPLDDGVGKVLSISSHGTGLNLQTQHNENLILCWPSSGSVCEQLFGRTHRFGQTQDEVHVNFYMPTPEAESALNKSRADAQYVLDTMKSPQKLLYGTWLDPEDSR